MTGKELSKAIRNLGYTKKHYAYMCNVTSSEIRDMCSGKTEVSDKVALRTVEYMGFKFDSFCAKHKKYFVTIETIGDNVILIIKEEAMPDTKYNSLVLEECYKKGYKFYKKFEVETPGGRRITSIFVKEGYKSKVIGC